MARGIDTTARQGTNPLEDVEARTPILSRNVPPRLNAMGNPEVAPQDVLSTLSPAKSQAPGVPTNSDAVMREVLRLQQSGQAVNIPATSTTYKASPQTQPQQALIEQTIGQATELYALHIMNDPAYGKLSDPQKADALTRSMTTAHKAADLTLDQQVTRDPHESALLQWAQTPHYYRVSGTPQEIADQNLRIEEARAKLAAYTAEYKARGSSRLRDEDPAAYALAVQSQPLDTNRLKRAKDAIDQSSGGELYKAAAKAASGGLVGAGSTVLDVP